MVDFKLNNTAFTLRQLNRARPARFDNRAGKTMLARVYTGAT